MKKSKREKIDKLFEDASAMSLDNLINEYPSPEELEGMYDFSDKHNKKMKKLFRKADKIENGISKDFWHTFRRISFNAAAVLCMLFTVFTLVAFTVPEIRVAITNYIVEENYEYVAINIESDMYESEIIEGAPRYIPEGYKIIDTIITEAIIDIVYENSSGKFIYYTRNTGETFLTLDNEDSDFKPIHILKIKGYIKDKNGEISLVFHDDEYTHTITSNADKKVIIEIAESIIEWFKVSQNLT